MFASLSSLSHSSILLECTACTIVLSNISSHATASVFVSLDVISGNKLPNSQLPIGSHDVGSWQSMAVVAMPLRLRIMHFGRSRGEMFRV
eukprot:COSAG02_NODE_4007_length_5920_cov_5.932829_5_plen_90_part_00